MKQGETCLELSARNPVWTGSDRKSVSVFETERGGLREKNVETFESPVF